MARLQILELPEGAGDARPPFVLVIDQARVEDFYPSADGKSVWQAFQERVATEDPLQRIAEQIGARHILVFEETIDIPANDVPVDPDGQPLFRAQVEEEIKYALGKVTRATNGQGLAHERTGIARDMDRLAKWKNEITDALGMDRTRDWDDIRNAARGIRRARDAQDAAIERVRQLHRPAEHRGQTICWECSAYDFPGQSTNNAPVAYDQCGTLRVLNGGHAHGQEQT